MDEFAGTLARWVAG